MNKRILGGLAVAVMLTGGLAFISAGAVSAEEQPGPIVVDGTPYQPTQVSGPVWHYETPTPNPGSARVEVRDQDWTGNGSENLPCPDGIHWVSNESVLTVSHCLGDVEPPPVEPPPVEPPVVEPPPVEPPVDAPPPAVAPPVVEAPVVSPVVEALPPAAAPTVAGAGSLPATGNDAAGVTALIAPAVTSLGGAALLAARRRDVTS